MSIYNYTDAGIITLNSDHLTEVVDGKAGMNEVTSFLGMFRHDYVDEFHNIRLGKGVANRKVKREFSIHRYRLANVDHFHHLIKVCFFQMDVSRCLAYLQSLEKICPKER